MITEEKRLRIHDRFIELNRNVSSPDSFQWQLKAAEVSEQLKKLLGFEQYCEWSECTWPGLVIDEHTWKEIYETTSEAVATLLDIPAPECDCNGANRDGCPVCVPVCNCDLLYPCTCRAEAMPL